MEDAAIVELYWQRAPEAIGHTQEKYGAYCLAIAGRLVPVREDAEECVNDTWLRAWNAMPTARPCFLAPFLGRITRNLALDKAAFESAQKRGSCTRTLPQSFDAALDGSGAQAYAAAVQRLADEYGAAFGMQAPQAAVQADYTVEGNVHLTNFVWDAAASPAQQLLFASCGRLSFSAGESGAILYEQPQPGRALGEYALISESEARAMLLQGQCLTSVPYAVESEADIAAVELCYREGSEVYAPWYRFWVKLPEEAQQNCAPGCTVYGAYYVPAVRGEYIAGAPAA